MPWKLFWANCNNLSLINDGWHNIFKKLWTLGIYTFMSRHDNYIFLCFFFDPSIFQFTKIGNVEHESVLIHVPCDLSILWKPWKCLFTHFCINLKKQPFSIISYLNNWINCHYLLCVIYIMTIPFSTLFIETPHTLDSIPH